MLFEQEVKSRMKCKTTAFLVLLIFTASIFAVTSTLPVMAGDSPNIETYDVNFGGGLIQPLDGDDVPGGGGSGP